jgi:hypothetical protein
MNEESETRLKSARRLVRLFRWERIAYLGMAAGMAILLLAAAVLMFRPQGDEASLTLLAGTTGLLLFLLGRTMRMWDRAYRLISEERIVEADSQ